MTKPVLKWVGGKRQLLDELLKKLPEEFNTYYEPFFGGGALYFKCDNIKSAVISDLNTELITVYKVIKKDVHSLIKELRKHQNKINNINNKYEDKLKIEEEVREYFLKIRALDRSKTFNKLSDAKKAARTIFLNKTAFNGLYRVNSKNEFNAPYGKYLKPKILDEKNLIEVSLKLKNTKIYNKSFTEVLKKAKSGDLLYLDPPYVPITKTSNFTSYTAGGFSMEDQEQLLKICQELDKKGVKFILSNSAADWVINSYKEFNISEVYAKRNINAKGDGRGYVKEVIITNF